MMRRDGLVDEVKGLLQQGITPNMVSMQGLGYKEIIDALQGSCSFEEAFERIKRETRHFAKRQFTWFRRERDVTWIDKETYEMKMLFAIYDRGFEERSYFAGRSVTAF